MIKIFAPSLSVKVVHPSVNNNNDNERRISDLDDVVWGVLVVGGDVQADQDALAVLVPHLHQGLQEAPVSRRPLMLAAELVPHDGPPELWLPERSQHGFGVHLLQHGFRIHTHKNEESGIEIRILFFLLTLLIFFFSIEVYIVIFLPLWSVCYFPLFTWLLWMLQGPRSAMEINKAHLILFYITTVCLCVLLTYTSLWGPVLDILTSPDLHTGGKGLPFHSG